MFMGHIFQKYHHIEVYFVILRKLPFSKLSGKILDPSTAIMLHPLSYRVSLVSGELVAIVPDIQELSYIIVLSGPIQH